METTIRIDGMHCGGCADRRGRGVRALLGPGGTDGADPIRHPAGVAVDDEGTGFVTDFFGSSVRRVECP